VIMEISRFTDRQTQLAAPALPRGSTSTRRRGHSCVLITDARLQVRRDIDQHPAAGPIAIGLAGSQVMSATVDVWGWRARLARGQTITDVTRRILAIESGLGTFRGAVRIYPTPDDLANRRKIRVLDVDPHAASIPRRGPSVTSVTQPIDMGHSRTLPRAASCSCAATACSEARPVRARATS
jgi:hypothetical protein